MSQFKDHGTVVPTFAASTAFSLLVNPPDGILEGLELYNYGAHTTAITTAETDAEQNIINTLRITINLKDEKPIISNVAPRRLKWLTYWFRGDLPPRGATTGDAGTHFGVVDIPFIPPDHLIKDETKAHWGIDTRKIIPPILVEGAWGPIAAGGLGVGATAATSNLRVSSRVRPRKVEDPAPWFALLHAESRLTHDTDANVGPDRISTADADALFGVMFTQHDNSATTAQRVDGLITRYRLSLAGQQVLNQYHQSLQKSAASLFRAAVASIPAGVAFYTVNPSEYAGYPSLVGSLLELEHDSVEAVTNEVTDVTPAASDAVFTSTVGIRIFKEFSA